VECAGFTAGFDVGRVRVEPKKSVPALFFRRRSGSGGGITMQIDGAISKSAGRWLLHAAVSPTQRGRRKTIAGNNPVVQAGHYVDRLEHTHAGKIHGGISTAAGCNVDDWCRGGVRLSQWSCAAGAALDTAKRAGVVPSLVPGIPAADRALFAKQPAVRA